jgi:arsenite methyltransferase
LVENGDSTLNKVNAMATASGSASGRRLAFYSGLSAVLAFIACNGLILATAVLAVLGITLSINPHVQAVLISLFAVLTAILLFRGFLEHRKVGPLMLASTGALVILLTMYVSYSKLVESIGLVALVAAAGWNWYIARQPRSDA